MIIFVCKANYCRSPVAERLLKHLRPDLNVISRGIINFTRMSMDPRSMKYLELKNINSTQHQPTKIDMQTIELGSNIMQSQIILPEGVSLSNNILNSQDQPVASVCVTRAALDIDDEIATTEGEEEGAEESADAAETSEDSNSDSESKE